MDKKRTTGWFVLLAIVVVAAVAVALTNSLTKGPIADQNQQESQAALNALFPEAERFEPLQPEANSGVDFAYAARVGDETVGGAARATVQGYGGPIEVIAGLNADGTLRGISVGGSDFAETEGLGSRTKEPSFTDQFRDQKPPLALGDGIDAVSGATVSSRAVVSGANQAAQALHALLGGTGDATDIAQQPGESAGARTANASVMSYNGPVLVNLTVDDAGAITALTVGAARFQEHADYGAKTKDPAFTSQFIGKTPPLALGKDVDAVSGATSSSQAVVDAVNEAYQFMQE